MSDTTTGAAAGTSGETVKTSQATGAGTETATTQTQATTQTPAQAQTQAGTGTGSGGQGDTPKTFTQEDVDRIITERLASEQARQAKKVKEEKDKAEAAALAEKGEFEKLAEQRRVALEQRDSELREERTRNQMLTLASKHQVADADFVFKAVRGDIEYDADGKALNLDKLVEQAIKRIPGLVQPGGGLPPSGGGTNAGKTSAATGSFTRSQIADPTFFQANKAAIMLAAKEGRITNE